MKIKQILFLLLYAFFITVSAKVYLIPKEKPTASGTPGTPVYSPTLDFPTTPTTSAFEEPILFPTKTSNVLDLCIFFDTSQEFYLISQENGRPGPGTKTLAHAICQNEAIITSTQLLQALIKSAEKEKKIWTYINNIPKNINYADVAKKLLQNWLIYKTENSNFAVLIPKSTYNDVIENGTLDLKQIGLNEAALGKPLAIPSIEELEKAFSCQAIKSINLDEFKKIFLENTDVIKRIYLAGHGIYEQQIKTGKTMGPIITQLTIKQFIDLMKFFKKIHCTFLYLESCYTAGQNILKSQMQQFEEQKNVINTFEKIAKEIPFIIVVGSLVDSPGALKEIILDFKTFFTSLHMFFQEEIEKMNEYMQPVIQKRLLELKKTQEEIKKIKITEKNKEKIEETKKNINIMQKSLKEKSGKIFFNEMDLLTGKVWKKTYYREPRSYIEASPLAIKNLKSTLLILTGEHIFRHPSIRIPGMISFVSLKTEKIKKISQRDLTRYFIRYHRKRKNIKNITIKEKQKYLLIYPNSITVPIELKTTNPPKIFPMVSGASQHFIKKIIVPNDTNPNTFLQSITKSLGYEGDVSTRLLFIEKIKNKNKETLFENIAIKIKKQNKKRLAECIYQNIQKEYFISEEYDPDLKYSEIKFLPLNPQKAKETIIKWTAETKPSKAALYEATEGLGSQKTFIKNIARSMGIKK